MRSSNALVLRRMTGGGQASSEGLLDRLPDDCSVEDVLYHLYVLQAVERGQEDAAAGRVISMRKWSAMRRKWLRGAGT